MLISLAIKMGSRRGLLRVTAAPGELSFLPGDAGAEAALAAAWPQVARRGHSRSSSSKGAKLELSHIAGPVSVSLLQGQIPSSYQDYIRESD